MTGNSRSLRLRQRQSGQAIVEFTLVLMFIILPVTAALIDSAFVLFKQIMITNIAREGARAGSIYQTTTAFGADVPIADQIASMDAARKDFIRHEASTQLNPLIDLSGCNLSDLQVSYNPEPPALGNPYRQFDSVTVSLACPHHWLFGIITLPPVTLQSQATMRIEPGGIAPNP